MKQAEAAMQRDLFTWARLAEARIPELRWLAHWPNGGLRNPIVAKQLKGQGVKPGPWDNWLPVRRGDYVGLVVELKAGKNKLTPDQAAWGDHLASQGWQTAVCYSWDAARAAICAYLGVKP